jgi:hypothetical protein
MCRSLKNRRCSWTRRSRFWADGQTNQRLTATRRPAWRPKTGIRDIEAGDATTVAAGPLNRIRSEGIDMQEGR